MADDESKDAAPEPKPNEVQATPLASQPAADLDKSLRLVFASVGQLIQAMAATLGKQTTDSLDNLGKQVTAKVDGYLATLEGDDKSKKKAP